MSENHKLPNAKGLSQREIETLTLVAAGHTDLEIADRLGIHCDTVQNHLLDIFKKINAPNRLQAAFWVAKNL
jgi:two-component system nitrate/nitrite response regulator NarL